MANITACLSSKRDDWETPQDFFDKINKEFAFQIIERQMRITTVRYHHDKKRCCSQVSSKSSKQSIIKSKHFIYRLAASVLPTNDSECSLWLTTPTAATGTKGRSAKWRKGKTPNPQEFVQKNPVNFWRTPQACNATQGSKSREFYEQCQKTGQSAITLTDQVRFFPTPVARQRGDCPAERARRTPNLESVVKPTACGNHNRQRISKSSGDGLSTAVKHANNEMYATPQSRDYRIGQTERWDDPGRRSRNLNDQVGGSLNPDWVDWLMGFPSGWTNPDIESDKTHDPHIWDEEPDIPRLAKGVKHRVARLKADGNAVVPRQAYPIFAAIMSLEGEK